MRFHPSNLVCAKERLPYLHSQQLASASARRDRPAVHLPLTPLLCRFHHSFYPSSHWMHKYRGRHRSKRDAEAIKSCAVATATFITSGRGVESEWVHVSHGGHPSGMSTRHEPATLSIFGNLENPGRNTVMEHLTSSQKDAEFDMTISGRICHPSKLYIILSDIHI